MYNFTLYMTTDCNFKCQYCYEDYHNHYQLNEKTLVDSLEFMMNYGDRGKVLIDFLGGEPLLKKDLIYKAVAYIKDNYPEREVKYYITTNCSMMDDRFIAFMKENHFTVRLSFDGNKETHDLNRVAKDGVSCYEKIFENIMKVKDSGLNFSVRMTVTENTIPYMFENICYLHEHGLDNICMIMDVYLKICDELKAEFEKQVGQILRYYLAEAAAGRVFTIDQFDGKMFNMLCDFGNCFGMCDAGIGNFKIFPNGQIYPCGFLTSNEKYCIGNIKEGVDIRKAKLIAMSNFDKTDPKCKGCTIRDFCHGMKCGYMNFINTGKINVPSDAECIFEHQPMLYMMRNQMSLSSGKVPEEEKQIAVCKKWLEKYGKDKKVGDKINLNTDQLSGEYTISGILDMTTSGETFPFLISWEKLENYENYNEDSNMVYVHVKEKNVEDIKKYCREIGEKNNLPVAFNNPYFRYVNQVISADQLGILGILIGLVLIGSYTVIKSIFQISIINKIQNYGQLRTIGTTQKQIKKIVKKEGRYLGVRGILTGISLAILCSAIILAKGINIGNYIVCAMITVAICGIIVSISINKPIKIAMKASPMESVRMTAISNIKISKQEKNRKLTPISLGIMNFKREPKKVWSIVISLSLGGIILLTVSSALLLQSPERMAQHYFGDADYKIYINSDKEPTEQLYSGNPLNDKLKEEIGSIPGIKEIQTLRKSATFE